MTHRSNYWRFYLPLAAWSLFLFVYGIHQGDLYRTEGLRARIAQEMLASGDWVVPTLYGQPIFTKPPGMYWLICLASWPGGEVTTISARLPSVFAGIWLVFLFAWLFRRALGEKAGLVAGLLAPMSIFWLDKVPSAEIDAVQVAWVASAIVFFLRAVRAATVRERCAPLDANSAPLRSRLRWSETGWWLLAMLCVAGGTLTKWTAPAFFYLTVGSLLWWRCQLKLLFSRGHIFGASLAGIVVGGWIAAAIAQTSPEAFFTALSREALPRLAPGANARPYPWLESLLHPGAVLLAALPWSILALVTLRPAFASTFDDKARLLCQGLHCWLWPNLLFWSLHPEHTLRNRAPIFPAFAGLAALAWVAWDQARGAGRRPVELQAGQRPAPRGWFRPRPVLVCSLALWMALKAIHVEMVLPRRDAHRQVRAKAMELAALMTGGPTLYLVKVKDEGLLFYLGGPVRRVASLHDAMSQGPVRALLTEQEWLESQGQIAMKVLGSVRDAQGDRLVLVLLQSAALQ